MQNLTLELFAGTFAVCRLAPDSPLPDGMAGGPFLSITRTADELSVVCPQDKLPNHLSLEGGWRCLRVAGKLDFSLVGVLASLLAPLAAVGISVFVVSTFNTDYLLVKAEKLDASIEVLTRAGYSVKALS
jgi:hypothetical protein